MPVERDPYEPPHAALQSDEPRRGAPLNALLAGFLVVFAGIALGGTAVRLATLLPAVQHRFDHVHLGIALRTSTVVLGFVAALTGGFVCARVARRRELLLGAVLGLLAVALGLLAGAGGPSPSGARAFAVATFVLVLIGSWASRFG